ncbi:MAG: hypothetical protein ACK5MB_07455 [Phycisphaerales bacterium]|jgi:hypothetical protein
MRTPQAPKEDPAVTQAREREQLRAEATRTEETQALRMSDTLRRLRRFGRLQGAAAAAGGGVSIVSPVAGGVGGASGGGGGASGGVGESFGSGGSFRGGGIYETAFY